MTTGDKWAIVLAAGEGSRLRRLTTDASGVVTRKQFCSVGGGPTLVEQAIARASRVVPLHHVVVVVAAEHAGWWRRQLARLPAGNIVVQPRNRGTAVGLLLPLLTVLARDQDATVLVLPADHRVGDEPALASAAREALATAASGAGGVILLGMAADAPTSDYGWIVPATRDRLAPVTAFVEKPSRPAAERLLANGGVWNTFILAARGQTLLALLDGRLPGLATDLRSATMLGGESLSRLYDTLSPADFSRDVLQHAAGLHVLRAPPCGWTDLGTPERVARSLASLTPA